MDSNNTDLGLRKSLKVTAGECSQIVSCLETASIYLHHENNIKEKSIEIHFPSGKRFANWLYMLKLGRKNGVKVKVFGPDYHVFDKWTCSGLYESETRRFHANLSKIVRVLFKKLIMFGFRKIKDFKDYEYDLNETKVISLLQEKKQELLSYSMKAWQLLISHEKKNRSFQVRLHILKSKKLTKLIYTKWRDQIVYSFAYWKSIAKNERFWLGRVLGNWRYYILQQKHVRLYYIKSKFKETLNKTEKIRAFKKWKTEVKFIGITACCKRIFLRLEYIKWVAFVMDCRNQDVESMKEVIRQLKEIPQEMRLKSKKADKYHALKQQRNILNGFKYFTLQLQLLRSSFERWLRLLVLQKILTKSISRVKIYAEGKFVAAFVRLKTCNLSPITRQYGKIEMHKKQDKEGAHGNTEPKEGSESTQISCRQRQLCRCVKCKVKYGRLGASPPRLRSCEKELPMIVVSESRCTLNEHLDSRILEGKSLLRRVLDLEENTVQQSTFNNHQPKQHRGLKKNLIRRKRNSNLAKLEMNILSMINDANSILKTYANDNSDN